MSDLLQLPVDPSVSFDNASYKNPGRIVLRTQHERPGWKVYYCMADGRNWPIGETAHGSEGTAAVFGVAVADKPLGVNETLAGTSFGQATASEIHDAEHFYVFAVSPVDGQTRSRVHRFHNDKYVPLRGDSGPPWRLQGVGVPKKVRGKRGIFDRYVDLPPDYEPAPSAPDPVEPPPTDPEPDRPPLPPSMVPDEIEFRLADVAACQGFDEAHKWPRTDEVQMREWTSGPVQIRAEWTPVPRSWPAYENDRFGALYAVVWTPGGIKAGRIEHTRFGVEEIGTTVAMWAGPPDNHQTLAETLQAKLSKFGEDISVATYRQVIAVFLAGRDDNRVRTGLLLRDGVTLIEDDAEEPAPDEPEPPEPPDEPNDGGGEGGDDQVPDPPPVPKPRFSNLLYPGESEVGDRFSIEWSTNEATHVALEREGTIITHALPTTGVVFEEPEEAGTISYAITAVSGDERWTETFTVEVRPRRISFWDIFRRLFG